MARHWKSRRRFAYGSVYQRKKRKKGKTWTSKKWTIDFYDQNGDRIQKVTPHAQSREEATHALMIEVQKTFNRNYRIERRRRSIGLKTFARSFLEDYMMTVRRNFRSDTYRLQKLCGYFEDVDLRAITPMMIEKFRKSILVEGRSKLTCNRYLQLLKRMFNVAIEEGYAEENPVTKVKLYSEKDTQKERILSEAEEKKLLEACSDHLKPIIAVALNTGMRRAEILNLQWSQVDFKARRIKVERTKSGRVRYIPMNEPLLSELCRLKSGGGQSPHVFTNPRTGKQYIDMKTSFKGACRRANIEGLRFHDLRHTFASRLVEKGADIETVRNLLGHHSITITQRYTHSTDDRKRSAVELLSSKVDGKIGDNLVTQENQSKLIH